MGFCYFLYSGGVVVGLWATPLVARPLGWQAVYIVYTAIGLAWAVRPFTYLQNPPLVSEFTVEIVGRSLRCLPLIVHLQSSWTIHGKTAFADKEVHEDI